MQRNGKKVIGETFQLRTNPPTLPSRSPWLNDRATTLWAAGCFLRSILPMLSALETVRSIATGTSEIARLRASRMPSTELRGKAACAILGFKAQRINWKRIWYDCLSYPKRSRIKLLTLRASCLGRESAVTHLMSKQKAPIRLLHPAVGEPCIINGEQLNAQQGKVVFRRNWYVLGLVY